MRKFNKNKGLKSGALEREAAGSAQVVDIKAKMSVPNVNDKLPDHVWAMLQECGEEAAQRLLDLLNNPSKFNKLGGSTQANLIRLAFEYAYGKPDAPLKRSVAVNLTGAASDGITQALEGLAGEITLPEYGADQSSADLNRVKDKK